MRKSDCVDGRTTIRLVGDRAAHGLRFAPCGQATDKIDPTATRSTPLIASALSRHLWIAGPSKKVLTGLRLAFLVAPRPGVALIAGLYVSSWPAT